MNMMKQFQSWCEDHPASQEGMEEMELMVSIDGRCAQNKRVNLLSNNVSIS